MSNHFRLFLSSLCLSVALGAHIAAQDVQSTQPSPAVERELERAVRVLSEQNALDTNQARELERAARRLVSRQGLNAQSNLEVRRVAQALGAQQGRSGGARSSGPGADWLNGAFGGPVIAGAPFSADIVTTVTQTLGDGTRLEQRVTGRLFRDGSGRVRREQTILGLDAVDPAERSRMLITLDSTPGDPTPYILDPIARTARRAPRGLGLYFGVAVSVDAAPGQTRARLRLQNTAELSRVLDLVMQSQALSIQRDALGIASAAIPPDVKPSEESLGQRQVEGVLASGRRITTIIPTDRIGNDRPIFIVDEQWLSPQLNIIVSSRYSDPRTGVIEYRLTNITRGEPDADLFTVPADYTVVGGGAGGRGAAPGPRSGGPGR